MTSNILGLYLKRKRMEVGMSQMTVAEKLGYTTPQYISNFERGLCPVSLKILKKIAALYKLDMSEFFNVVLEQQTSDISSVLFAKQKKVAPKKKIAI